MDLKTPNLLGTRLGQPSQDGTAPWIGFDKLLSAPKPFCWRVGGNPDHVFFGNAELDQTGYMGTLGWTHQQDLATSNHKAGQCR